MCTDLLLNFVLFVVEKTNGLPRVFLCVFARARACAGVGLDGAQRRRHVALLLAG